MKTFSLLRQPVWNRLRGRYLIIGVLTLALALLAGCNRRTAATQPGSAQAQKVKVELANTRTAPVQRSIEAVGTLWGQEDVTIATKVPGRVVGVFKDVGDRVVAGEPLVQLDPIDLGLIVKQKQMSITEILARLGIKPDMKLEDLTPEMVPTVRRASLQTQNAKDRLERGRQLHEQKPPLISDQEYADLQTAWEVAKSSHEVELLLVATAVAQVLTSQIDLQLAQQRLDDTTVRAPATPTGEKLHAANPAPGLTYSVADRMASVGQYVREGDKLFRLVADDVLKLRAMVPEREVARVRVGQEALVRVEAYEQAFPGQVTRINVQVDPANRTFEVEISVPNAQRQLRPGSFARASILIHLDPQVVFVPQDAVVSFAGVQKVFVVEQGKAREIMVDLGDLGSKDLKNYMEVRRGMDGHEMVVVSGTSKLATGVEVDILSQTPSAASAPASQAADAAGR